MVTAHGVGTRLKSYQDKNNRTWQYLTIGKLRTIVLGPVWENVPSPSGPRDIAIVANVMHDSGGTRVLDWSAKIGNIGDKRPLLALLEFTADVGKMLSYEEAIAFFPHMEDEAYLTVYG